jgi:hypothetical protein
VALLGLAATVAGARGGPLDDKDAPPDKADGAKGSWLGNWFGKGDKPKADEGKVVDKPTRPPSAAREQKRAMNAFLRRMQVCDRLREIAYNTNDTELEQQANDLEEQARRLYEQQTARLPRGGSADEVALEKSVGTSTARPQSRGPLGRDDDRAAVTERKP